MVLKDHPKVERFFLIFGSFLLVVGFLYWAKPVFIPLAIALLLTFILAPLVSVVQRTGVHRVPAVLLVVILVFLLLGGILSVFVAEVKALALELPTYKTRIDAKIGGLREASTQQWWANILEFADGVNKYAIDESQTQSKKVEPVPVKMESSTVLPFVQSIAGPVLEFLINAVLVFILVVFMLVRREDMRNRLIRLWGHRNLTSTTRVLDEASQRISRFLLAQFVLNICFGVVLALGLMVIGIPYAYIWGILAALLRYVPYLGPWMAAVFPLFVSLVMPGWTAFFAVLGFFVVLELIHSNVTEPLIFGHSIGVSGVALLVSALFWTWLWGPLGLVLSIPLTACLFVFGRNIPSLEFLSLMLGDEPVLKKSAMFYQRLLARDPEEAEELVEMYLKDHSVEQVYQDVLFPALMHARRDREADALTEEDHAFVLEATRDIFNDVVLPMHLKNQPQPKDKVSTPRSLVLTIPAQDETDALALDIFKEALNPDLFEAISATPNFLDNGKKNELRQTPSHVVLLTLSNKNLLRFRVLAKKIKASYPNAKIIVGCWGIEKDMELARDRLVAIGVDGVGTTFAETRELLNPSNETPA